jgi:hypothetical protein
MILLVLRGLSRITAAVTGLLLLYGVIFTMDGMTTRIFASRGNEFVVTCLAMLPWTLLICSGLEDFQIVTRQSRLVWVGVFLTLALLWYLEQYTTEAIITRVGAPLLAMAGGLLPLGIRYTKFIFPVCSVAVSFPGAVVLYFVVFRFLDGAGVATEGADVVVILFGIASVITAPLTMVVLRRNRQKRMRQ